MEFAERGLQVLRRRFADEDRQKEEEEHGDHSAQIAKEVREAPEQLLCLDVAMAKGGLGTTSTSN